MTINHHPPGEHLSTCSGPENCCEYRTLLSMTPTEKAAWLTQDRARRRLASAHTRQFRASTPPRDNFAPPDPYAADLAALRAANAKAAAARTATLAPRPTPPREDFTPPNSYARDLEQLRRNR